MISFQYDVCLKVVTTGFTFLSHITIHLNQGTGVNRLEVKDEAKTIGRCSQCLLIA